MVTNLSKIRKARGLTQEELAQATGISRITIARYETNKMDPTAEKLRKLASVLNVAADDLIGGEEES